MLITNTGNNAKFRCFCNSSHFNGQLDYVEAYAYKLASSVD